LHAYVVCVLCKGMQDGPNDNAKDDDNAWKVCGKEQSEIVRKRLLSLNAVRCGGLNL
jgi:hypothetical protein